MIDKFRQSCQKYPLCHICMPRFLLSSCLFTQEIDLLVKIHEEHVMCLACLGDMKGSLWSKTIPCQLVDAFQAAGYDASVSSFSLAIALPHCHAIRQRIVWELFQEEFTILNVSWESFLKPLSVILADNFKVIIRDRIVSCLSSSSLCTSFHYQSTASLQVIISLITPLSGKLCALIWSAPIKPFLPSKLQHHHRFRKILMESKTAMDALVQNLTKEFLFSHCKIKDYLLWKSLPVVKKITMTHTPIYIAGRYIKNARNVSQSPWCVKKIQSEDMTAKHDVTATGFNDSISSSVSGIIGDYLQMCYRASDTRFSSAGREDADVRMLGSGRPFLIELINPKLVSMKVSDHSDTWSIAIDKISKGSVQVPQFFQVNGQSASAELKDGEETKCKVYRCVIWSRQSLDEATIHNLNLLKNIHIHQKTPIRVIQRRANLIRDKMLYQFSAQFVNDRYFILYLSAQAGTYIKEFVHGNFGRTNPSLGDLMFHKNNAFDLIELDVLHIDLPEWPPASSILS